MKKAKLLLLAAALTVTASVGTYALKLTPPETLTESYADITAEAALYEDYGTLVYENTYDAPSEITSKPIPVVASGIGTVDTAGALYGMGYTASYTLETPAGMSSPMVRVSGQGPYVPAAYVGGTINAPGTYTLAVDYYIPQESGNVTMDCGFGALKSGSNGIQFREFFGTQGRLTTFTLTYELTEGNSFGGIYIARAYTAGSFYIDAMRLYYKAPAPTAITATVYTSSAQTDAFAVYDNLAAGDTVTLPSAREFSDSTPSDKYLNGFGIGKNTYTPGAVYTVSEDDVAAGVLAVVPIFGEQGKPGALIYENRFETGTDGYLHAAENHVGTANSSNVYNRGTGAVFSVETPAGMTSPMMKITPAAGASGAEAAWVNMKLTSPGTYTLDFDYYCPTSTNTDGRVLRCSLDQSADEMYFVKGSLQHVVYPANLAQGSTFGSMSVMMRYGSNYSADDVFYIDNLRLYYTPDRPAVNINVLDAGGNVSFNTDVASGDSFTLPSSMPKPGSVLTGFACGDSVCAPGTAYTVTAADALRGYLDFTPVYVQITPIHPACGTLILQETFENVADGTVIYNFKGNGGIFDAYKNAFIATQNLSEDAAFAGKQFCFTRGNALNTSYVTTMSGVKGVAVAQGENKYPVFGLAGGNSNANESLALTEPGIYTVYADFGIREKDLANIKQVFVQVTGIDGSTRSFSLSEGLTSSSLNTVKAEVIVKAGDGIKMICFAAETASADDAVVLMVDNIELYHSAAGAVSVPKNTEEYSIRLGKTRGMRMTSFVSVLQRELADEYGFIVAVADRFGGDYSGLVFPEDKKGNTALEEGVTGKGTLASGVNFVYATSYAKAADGTVTTDIHKIGAFGDEDGFRMNAVLVNISAEMYTVKFAVRPYVRVGDSYFYGETMVKSIQDVAKVFCADNDYIASLSEDDFYYISAILEAKEA